MAEKSGYDGQTTSVDMNEECAARPDAGTNVPASKDDKDNTESLRQDPSVHRSGAAKDLAGEVQKGAAVSAAKKESDDSLTRANSGCNCE